MDSNDVFDCISDASDSQSGIYRSITSSRASSSTMSTLEVPCTSSSSSESLTGHLYFTPREPLTAGLERGKVDMFDRNVDMSIIKMEVERTPIKTTAYATGVPEKNNPPISSVGTKPVAVNLMKKFNMGKRSLARRRISKQRHQYGTPSLMALQGMQKIANRIVRKKLMPMEALLSSVFESIRVNIKEIVKNEIDDALAEFRCMLNERLPEPKKPAQRRTKLGKGSQKVSQPKSNLQKIKEEKVVETVIKHEETNCDSSVEPSSQETRIIWANKRTRSTTLMEKLKRYLEEQKGEEIAFQAESPVDCIDTSATLTSTESIFTPPNSPVSTAVGSAVEVSPYPPKLSLGLVSESVLLCDVKKEPQADDEVELGKNLLAPDANQPESKEPAAGVSVKLNSAWLTSGPEPMLKPELPIRKFKDSILCNICGKNFQNNSSMKQHMSFHRPQRPYRCEQPGCDKAYKTRSELNRHVIVHAGIKAHVCKQSGCGKKFLRKQYLKTHLLRHSEPLIWPCKQCSKIFVSEEDVNKHMVSYHKQGRQPSHS